MSSEYLTNYRQWSVYMSDPNAQHWLSHIMIIEYLTFMYD